MCKFKLQHELKRLIFELCVLDEYEEYELKLNQNSNRTLSHVSVYKKEITFLLKGRNETETLDFPCQSYENKTGESFDQIWRGTVMEHLIILEDSGYQHPSDEQFVSILPTALCAKNNFQKYLFSSEIACVHDDIF